MILKGFRFGMLLQIAIGPVCLFIFQSASRSGFISAMTGVAAVTLVDGLYILFALLGIGAVLEKKSRLKVLLHYLGGLVLILFGISTLLSVFDIALLPRFSLYSKEPGSIFLRALLLTLSNPLTILFWAGVFSTKVAELSMRHSDMFRFGLGAILSTGLFLSLICALGTLTQVFLPAPFLAALTLAVGFVLIGFGIRALQRQPRSS